jgi:hypothetical protein
MSILAAFGVVPYDWGEIVAGDMVFRITSVSQIDKWLLSRMLTKPSVFTKWRKR